MSILFACEESQECTKAFRKLGYNAYSCDLLPESGGHREWHIRRDIAVVLKERQWDAVIAFPPCTNLSSSGARWFAKKKASGVQQESIDFFMQFVEYECRFKCIENPIGIMSTVFRKPDQIIQPWQFGHGEVKSTCLWLFGLPKLIPTQIVDGREMKIWRMAPSANRGTLRSKTYPGIAKAMAEQWGDIIARAGGD